jgi:hypothetical protein
LISKLAQIDGFSKEYLLRYETVFDSYQKNRYQMNSTLQSRMFEYAVVNSQNGLANSTLKSLGAQAHAGE